LVLDVSLPGQSGLDFQRDSERTCFWTRTRRAVGRSNGSANLARGRFSVDFIMNTAGCSIRQAQVLLAPICEGGAI
jgi:hypothetical protein